MPTHYSAKFREKMLKKMTGPGAWSASSLGRETGVPAATLSRWLREAKLGPMTDKKKSKTGSKRKRWTPEEMMRVVMEAAGADEAGRGALKRREGLHEADLERFHQEMIDAGNAAAEARKKFRGPTPEQRRIKKLEKELKRKEKALAETAALLVLSKKAEALFPSEEEGEDMDERSE